MKEYVAQGMGGLAGPTEPGKPPVAKEIGGPSVMRNLANACEIIEKAISQEQAKRARLAKGRSDLPIVPAGPAGRRSKGLATPAAGGKETAPRELKDDKVFQSWWKPRDSLMKAWSDLHGSWLQGSTPALPLTVEKLKAVCAMLKKRNHRCAGNCLGRTQEEHLMAGFHGLQTARP
jgi:hypothetical protein